MFDFIFKYFSLHHNVGIPGIGIFKADRTSARVDFTNEVIKSPCLPISFTEQPSISDNRFYSFVAREMQVDEVEAMRQVHEFSIKLKQDVTEQKHVKLPGIGTLGEDTSGQILFEADRTTENYFPPAVAKIIVQNGVALLAKANKKELVKIKKQEVLVKDEPDDKEYWWLYAIIIAIIAIAAIIFYYSRYPNP